MLKMRKQLGRIQDDINQYSATDIPNAIRSKQARTKLKQNKELKQK